MKTKIYAAFFIALFLISAILVGCAAKNGVYGRPFSKTNITNIGDILANPQQYERETVQIEGKIIEECPAGGWFMLKDATGVIYVDLHSSYFAIPQVVGSKVAAEGIVKKDGPRIYVTGKGVEIR
jgi:uncharacterized protein YdeI (BOF family)